MLGIIGLIYFYFNSNLSLAKYFNSNFMIKHKFWILEYQSLIWKSQLLLNQLSYENKQNYVAASFYCWWDVNFPVTPVKHVSRLLLHSKLLYKSEISLRLNVCLHLLNLV